MDGSGKSWSELGRNVGASSPSPTHVVDAKANANAKPNTNSIALRQNCPGSVPGGGWTLNLCQKYSVHPKTEKVEQIGREP